MDKEIQKILENPGFLFPSYGVYVSANDYDKLRDYIKRITEKLRQANDKIKTLEEINDYHRQLNGKLRVENDSLKSKFHNVLHNTQRIIDYGYDYDGFSTVKDLQGLIDMLVEYALDSRKELIDSKETEK